ncbi:MAG: hypothetical protein BroJett011_69450 [Chloroflexota bacterium]|nr:MAG: hypothetical protein BroJett011_69450 [Chloroflexota bacterium]
MSFNEITTPVYYRSIQLMFSQKPINDGMNELNEVVRNLIPHPIWDKLRRINYDGELPQLKEWIGKEISSHQYDVSILLFSLSDLGDVISLYFLRQEREPNGESDWGAYDDNFFSVIPSKVLEQMYELAEAELSDGRGGYTNYDVRWIVETCYPLAYAGLIIGEIIQTLPVNILLGKDVMRRVAIFFAEGDDFFFGEITGQGFKYYTIPDFVS